MSGPDLVSGTPAGCALGLERTEEALHSRVAPDLAGPTHAATDALFVQQLLEILAGALATLVRVAQQGHCPAPAPHRHHQRVSHELGGHALLRRPAHDATGVQVKHRRYVQRAFCRPDVGEVRHPFLV